MVEARLPQVWPEGPAAALLVLDLPYGGVDCKEALRRRGVAGGRVIEPGDTVAMRRQKFCAPRISRPERAMRYSPT